MQSKILFCFLVALAIGLVSCNVAHRRYDSCSDEGRVSRGYGYGHGQGRYGFNGWGAGRGYGGNGQGSRYGGRRNFDLGRNNAKAARSASWERVDMPRWKKYSTMKPTHTKYARVSPDGHVKNWGQAHSSGK
jgi:hypothetical protein